MTHFIEGTSIKNGMVKDITPALIDAMIDSFGPAFNRLAEIKRRYDPGNQFRLNRNIKPAA